MLLKLFFALTRFFLRFRYRIEVRGLESLKREAGKGVLVLPNHPALMDPVIVFALLWPIYEMRPLVVEHMFRAPLLRPFMKILKALPVPNFDGAVNEMKVRRAEQSIGEIAEGLKQGKSFIIYPSGRLKSTGAEVLGGASSSHKLVEECKGIDVVLVRTSGLWGSSYSRAIEGRSPDLLKTILHSFKTALKNFFFFAPRRDVLVELERSPNDFPWNGSRIEFNRYLENWFNQYPDGKGNRVPVEPLSLVSYSFWREDLLEPYQFKQAAKKSHGSAIPAEVRDKVYAEIRRIMDKPDLEIRDEMSLAFDVGMDSLNVGDMISFLSHHYDIAEVHPEDLTDVLSVLEIAAGARVSDRQTAEVKKSAWKEEKGRPGAVLPYGNNLVESFLFSCDRLGSYAACGDDLIGVLSYKKMKRAALVLAQSFKSLEGKYVGVMLPASAGAFLVIMGLQLAGKVPVMLNWTLGPRYLSEMMKAANANIAISSWRFLERLSHVEFGELTNQMVLLEDIREKLTWKQKLKGAFISLFRSAGVIRSMGLNRIDENEHAVVLFTSGTEAVPKGVPLTHKNIMSNLRSGSQCIDVRPTDVMYGILPPFHSFGFTVAGLFPLFCGMKIAFYPDPTDSFALAEGIDRWKITMFCSAPGFLKGLLAAAKPEQLKSVRYFVTGAERLPNEVREKALAMVPSALLVEGYGITECSPILTICRPNYPPIGVGRPVPDVEMRTIHPETLEPLPPGSEGEICVRGPNVFNGYLGRPRDPFIELDGQRWYRTGDLGRLDSDGNLILSGRLKRFTKLGGEMISLGAVEEVLSTELLKTGKISDELPTIAVCSDERVPGKPLLILFTTLSLSRDEANEILKASGFSRLVKISSVQKIEEIPLLGTGKTDYRRLQSNIA